MAEPAESVFNPSTNGEVEPQALPVNLEDWVGEGKKFNTVEDLAKSYAHSQEHIGKVESSYKALQADLDKRLTVKEMVAEIQTQKTEPVTTVVPEGDQNPVQGMKPEDVKSQIDIAVGDLSTKLQHQANERMVSDTLREKLGKDAVGAELEEKAKAAGITVDDMRLLAQTNPKVVLAMFPEKPTTPSGTQLHSSVNTDTAQFNKSGKPGRTFADYEKLRKENEREYFSQRVQSQMFEDAKGEGFYD